MVSTTAPQSNSRILIAGAGPTGLALGLCLRAYGIDADIVDPKAGPTRDSKAVAISPLARHQLALIGEDGTIGRDALILDRLELRHKEGEDDAVDLLWHRGCAGLVPHAAAARHGTRPHRAAGAPRGSGVLAAQRDLLARPR